MSNEIIADDERPIESFEGLVHRVVWRIIFTRNIPWHIQIDDLLQEGRIGLWRAQKVYKPGAHRFVSFAARDIAWAVKNYIRTHKYMRFSAVEVADPSILYESRSKQPNEKHEAVFENEVNIRDILNKVWPYLNTVERQIIQMRFIDDHPWKEVSLALNLDEQQHKHMVRMIRKRIEEIIGPQGIIDALT